MEQKTESSATVTEKVLVSIFYASSSIAIMMLNKVVLTSYNFPSSNFIALLQSLVTLLVLGVQRIVLQTIQFPLPPLPSILSSSSSTPSSSSFFSFLYIVFQRTMPLPLFFLLNTVTGLSATKELNMPMFVLLRRFSIMMTLGLEMHYLHKQFHSVIYVSVGLMLSGALIAAAGDLQWHLFGYMMILGNDLFTALQGVTLRHKMDEETKYGQKKHEEEGDGGNSGAGGIEKESTTAEGAESECAVGQDSNKESPTASSKEPSKDRVPLLNMHGLMFYNNVFSLPIILFLLCCIPHPTTTTRPNTTQHAEAVPIHSTEIERILHYDASAWHSPVFILCLFGTSIMGFVLNYSYFLCAKLTSPLTCTVIGCLKNVLTTYIGMIFKDYYFTMVNFIGMNISVVGSLLYNYAEFTKKKEVVKKSAAASVITPLTSVATGGSRMKASHSRDGSIL